MEHSNNQLWAYYDRHHITEFPKRQDGSPDMRKKFNKRHLAAMCLQPLLKQSKEEEDSPSESKECPICYETIDKSKVVLECNHTFCIECFTKFMHQKNTCPLCRVPFMQRSFESMDDDYVNDLIGNVMRIPMYNIPNTNTKGTIEEMIKFRLTHMSYANKKDTVNMLVDAVEHESTMVALNVRNYYETQLFG